MWEGHVEQVVHERNRRAPQKAPERLGWEGDSLVKEILESSKKESVFNSLFEKMEKKEKVTGGKSGRPSIGGVITLLYYMGHWKRGEKRTATVQREPIRGGGRWRPVEVGNSVQDCSS